jgi:regulatory protein
LPVLESTLAAIKNYCAYQERCHSEVRSKLISLACYGEDLEEAIGILIEENYLNEERFATTYAGSKFRLQSWGKIKIKQQLKAKQVSDYCIRKAMASIDEAAYEEKLYHLMQKKIDSLSAESNQWKKKQKVFNYLLQKGFEQDIIHSLWNSQEKM